MALSDLNKGVVDKVMNLKPSDVPVILEHPNQQVPVDNTPKPLDTPLPSQRTQVVPSTMSDFPDVPTELFGENKPVDQQKPDTGIPPSQLPPPGTAHLSDKDKNFATLRRNYEATAAELVELKSKYFDSDGKSLKPEFVQSKDEVERLKQELQLTQDRLARYNLMEDPRFVKKYQSKIGKIESEAKRIIKDFGVEDTLLKEVQGLSPKQRHDLILQKAPDAQYMLEPLLSQIDQIKNEQQSELDDWQNTVKTLDIERTGETEMKIRQIKESLHSSITRQLEDEGHFLLKTIPGNEKWNHGVSQIKQDMRSVLEVNDPKLQAKMLFQGVVAPVYMTLYAKERVRANELQRQLEIMGGTRPDIGSRGSSNPGGNQPIANDQATPMNAAKLNASKFFR